MALRFCNLTDAEIDGLLASEFCRVGVTYSKESHEFHTPILADLNGIIIKLKWRNPRISVFGNGTFVLKGDAANTATPVARFDYLNPAELRLLLALGIKYTELMAGGISIGADDLPRALNALGWCDALVKSYHASHVYVTRDTRAPKPDCTRDTPKTADPADDDCMDAAMDLLHRLRSMSLAQANAVLDITRIAVATRLSTEHTDEAHHSES